MLVFVVVLDNNGLIFLQIKDGGGGGDIYMSFEPAATQHGPQMSEHEQFFGEGGFGGQLTGVFVIVRDDDAADSLQVKVRGSVREVDASFEPTATQNDPRMSENEQIFGGGGSE